MHVLISGAGIAGPTLAWFLAKANIQVTIVEKVPTVLPHGQNVDLQEGSAQQVVKKMGLMEEILKHHTTEKGTQFVDDSGRYFAPFPVRPDSSASFTSEFEILRGDLAAILYRATKDFPNVKYIFGTTVDRVLTNDATGVKVELSDGQTLEADILVAADGQWSKLRKQNFPSETVTVIDKGMYVAYYTIPRLESDNSWWNVYVAPRSRVITTRPDPYGTIRVCLSVMPCNDAQKQAWQSASRSGRKVQSELVKREFADAGWLAQRIIDNMDQAPDFYFQAIQQIRMSKWSQNRIICLGDACFAPTPLTGMGTSLAIVGSYVLAGELSKMQEGEHPAKAFETYESTFKPFVQESQSIPSFVPSIAHPASGWKRWFLQTFMSTLSKIVSVDWIRNLLEAGGQKKVHDDNFILPEYPKFAEMAEK